MLYAHRALLFSSCVSTPQRLAESLKFFFSGGGRGEKKTVCDGEHDGAVEETDGVLSQCAARMMDELWTDLLNITRVGRPLGLYGSEGEREKEMRNSVVFMGATLGFCGLIAESKSHQYFRWRGWRKAAWEMILCRNIAVIHPGLAFLSYQYRPVPPVLYCHLILFWNFKPHTFTLRWMPEGQVTWSLSFCSDSLRALTFTSDITVGAEAVHLFLEYLTVEMIIRNLNGDIFQWKHL